MVKKYYVKRDPNEVTLNDRIAAHKEARVAEFCRRYENGDESLFRDGESFYDGAGALMQMEQAVSTEGAEDGEPEEAE